MANTTPPLPQVRQCNDPNDMEYGSVAVAAAFGDYAWFVGRPGFGGRAGGYWVPADSTQDKAIQTWAPGTFPEYSPPAQPQEETP